jgi:hypothetical protein
MVTFFTAVGEAGSLFKVVMEAAYDLYSSIA